MKRKYSISPNDLRHIYCKNDNITEENHEKLIDLWSDMYFVEGIQRVVKTQVEKSSAPTYLYKFSYDKDSPIKEYLFITMSGKSMMIIFIR